MSPLLYPFILILVCEFSTDELTKWVSRVMFYIYSIAMIVSLYFPSTSQTLFVVMMVYLVGYSFLIYKVKLIRIRVILGTLLILQSINYISLLSNNYSLYYMIPYYFEYSNIILRELSVMCITLCCITKGVDKRLKFGILFVYIMEYSYLVNI